MRKGTFVVAYAFAFMAAAALAEDGRIVSVVGVGETEVEPDVATIEMGVYVFDADLLKAKQEADRKIANLLEVFKALGVKSEDVQTSQIYVKPQYKTVDQDWKFLGYEITRSVTVTLRELTKLNAVLDKSIAAGANRLEEIELSSSRERELKEQTLTQAIENAKKQAARLAGGFGAKVGKVISIDTEETDTRPLGFSTIRNAQVLGEVTFQPGRIEISSSVSVVFELTD
jgi:uncharacterized protein